MFHFEVVGLAIVFVFFFFGFVLFLFFFFCFCFCFFCWWFLAIVAFVKRHYRADLLWHLTNATIG